MERPFALLALLFVLGCQKPSALPSAADARPGSVPATSQAAAGDVKSQCPALGRKVMDNTAVADGLAKTEATHYSAKNNRCYVQVTVRAADADASDPTFQQYLFDGQTGQMLAALRQAKGTRSGNIFVDPYPPNANPDELFVDAQIFINRLMTE